MDVITVGIADCRVSNNPQATLVTHALGSCIAVAVHDPVANVAGLLHFMLPEAAIDPDRARRQPYMFADSGSPSCFTGLRGGSREEANVSPAYWRSAGARSEWTPSTSAQRNHLACRKILCVAGVMVSGEVVGGTISRTVRLEVKTGIYGGIPGPVSRRAFRLAREVVNAVACIGGG
jgi:chemotaxis protein CheD